MASHRSSSGSNGAPMTLSQVPGSPTFRSSAVNAVAVIPLLSSDRSGHDDPNTYSSKSFQDLLQALHRYNQQNSGVTQPGEDLLLVVPNSNLTRPGDWKYDNTPLKNFHWGHGCQRMTFFDGRPYNSRMAHDRLINYELTRNWIDICPYRRTAALIGVLNVRDCPDEATLQRAEQEWRQWAERYSTPPYEVTAHGRDFERDFVVQRLFVFDSFHESNKVDVSNTSLGKDLVAFPPMDYQHVQVMDVHMNVVVNDLAVAIFQELEGKIRESDAITKGSDGQPLSSAAAKNRFFQLSGSSTGPKDPESPQGSANLSINNLAKVVSPDSQLAVNPNLSKQPSIIPSHTVPKMGSSSEAQLLTPLDDVWDYSELNPKDAHEMLKREVGRREKFAADLSLLAGSPLDAYERYMKAAELCKMTCPDPLWYASALEGCAAAHIAMAEAGGFNVDQYLESSFQLPDEMMACAIVPAGEKSNKQTMSRVVAALCDDALNVLSRQPKLACFRAELLLKLAWYTADVEDTHIRCQWGLGEGCYGGDLGSDKMRWAMASVTQFNFLELKNKKGEDLIARNTLNRTQEWASYMHQATSTGALDPVTRADVALRCASMCLKGLRPIGRPPLQGRSDVRVQLQRKAAFFAVAAAEALSEVDAGDTPDDRASAMWAHASKLLPQKGNMTNGGNYGWATLRAVALHGLALQGLRDTSEDAAVELLSLMGEIAPPKRKDEPSTLFAKDDLEPDEVHKMEDSLRSDGMMDNASYIAAESVVSAARTYVRETREKVAKARSTSFFSGQAGASSLLIVAQSKWVEDDPIPPVLLPMADFTKMADSVIAMRAVWSAIKFENCFTAQKKLLTQIGNLRKQMPASSQSGVSRENKSSVLPIKIISVQMINSESHSTLERVKVKRQEEDKGAMATFFNPYASKKGEDETIIVPESEERYIVVKFANKLSIPLEIPRCQLEFNIAEPSRIKAPAISFVIPGQTVDFAVQFPFIVLAGLSKEVSGSEENAIIVEIKGLHVTCLSRSFFVALQGQADTLKSKTYEVEPNIPEPSWVYPRRDYKGKKALNNDRIKSPRLEVVPSQPNLLISFARSLSPIDDDTVIPAPIADGETFVLPKLCLTNDSGLSGCGEIEELRISAFGLPGYSEVILFDLNGSNESTKSSVKKQGDVTPLSLTAFCEGMEKEALNQGNRGRASSVSLMLEATTQMGVHVKQCTITVSFRYRGKVPSSSVEVWRKRQIEIRVLKINGPRISSLTFRPDLIWDSAYSDLCYSLSLQGKHKRYRPRRAPDESALPRIGSTDDEEFIRSRLGKDSGVNVCGDKVVAFVSVSNETSSPILLFRPEGAVGGFENNEMMTMRVSPGVGAKIPMVLTRIDRAPKISSHLRLMTRLQWKTDSSGDTPETTIETSGTMVPVNRRVRSGNIEIPAACLKTIIDENPTSWSRICKAPCSVIVAIGGSTADDTTSIEVGKPTDVSVDIKMSDWVMPDVLRQNHVTLDFCCARKGISQQTEKSSNRRDFVWCGQIRKSLPLGNAETSHSHRARILFLREGEYFVSACVSFSRIDIEDDVKETWWAEKAQHVLISDMPTSQ